MSRTDPYCTRPCCHIPASTDDSDLRPFERRCDRPFRNLSEVHHAGQDGLNAAFPIGSLWDYGPFVEGQQPTVVRVIPCIGGTGPAYTSGENYSKQPEDSCALGNPTWFIACEIVFDPFAKTRGRKPVEGLPPHTLVPHVGCGTCYACSQDRPCYNCTAGCLQSQRAEIEQLLSELERERSRNDRLDDLAARERAGREAAQNKLAKVRKALS